MMGSTWFINDFAIVRGDLVTPSRHLCRLSWTFKNEGERAMVCEHFKSTTVNVRIESTYAFYDSKCFGVGGAISDFGTFQLSAEVGYSVRVSFNSLHEARAYCNVGCVRVNFKRNSKIRSAQNWSGN